MVFCYSHRPLTNTKSIKEKLLSHGQKESNLNSTLALGGDMTYLSLPPLSLPPLSLPFTLSLPFFSLSLPYFPVSFSLSPFSVSSNGDVI